MENQYKNSCNKQYHFCTIFSSILRTKFTKNQSKICPNSVKNLMLDGKSSEKGSKRVWGGLGMGFGGPGKAQRASQEGVNSSHLRTVHRQRAVGSPPLTCGANPFRTDTGPRRRHFSGHFCQVFSSLEKASILDQFWTRFGSPSRSILDSILMAFKTCKISKIFTRF